MESKNIDAAAVLPFGADNLARLLRNLDETSCNEGSEALACRLSDCRTVITELLADRASTVAKDTAGEVQEIGERTILGYGDCKCVLQQYCDGKCNPNWSEPYKGKVEAAHGTDSADEAPKLARILFGLCEGGGLGEDINIYADDFQAGDGDVYVYRAGELLATLAAENKMLGALVRLLESKLPTPKPEASAATQQVGGEVLTQAEIQDTIKAINAAMNPASGMFFPRGWNVLINKLCSMLTDAVPISEDMGAGIENERANFEDWYVTHIDGAKIGSADCAARWSAWVAGASRCYKAPGGWKIAPLPWNVPNATEAPDTSARDAALEEIAAWYKATGWLMDEEAVPDAIRALKSQPAPAGEAMTNEQIMACFDFDECNIVLPDKIDPWLLQSARAILAKSKGGV